MFEGELLKGNGGTGDDLSKVKGILEGLIGENWVGPSSGLTEVTGV